MTLSSRESANPLPRAPAPEGRTPQDDAVSPVVGMILVLAVSIVGIAAVLYWGLPAIDEMKANVEYRAVLTQFSEFDNTVKELVAGTTDKTAKRWQPAINDGYVIVQNQTEGWLFAVENNHATLHPEFAWSDVETGDRYFNISYLNASGTALPSVKVEAYLVSGTSSQTAINVSQQGVSSGAQMGNDIASWAANTERGFWLSVAGLPGAPVQEIKGGVYHFKILSGADTVGEAWYVNTGRVDYALEAGAARREIISNNGGVIVGSDGSYTLLKAPPVPPPITTGGTTRYFMRAVVLSGDASMAGEDRFDLLVSLYNTITLGSYDCVLTDKSDCVQSTKLFLYGDYRDIWYTYLDNDAHAYTFTLRTDPVSGVEYLEDRRVVAYTLIASNVQIDGGA